MKVAVCYGMSTSQSLHVLHVIEVHIAICITMFSANVYEATDCEGSHLLLECPEGQSLHVLEAFFGREDNLTCGGDVGYEGEVCSADDPLTLIRPLCEGRRSCPLYATSLIFGDPCGEVQMYLKVRFMCAGRCPDVQ